MRDNSSHLTDFVGQNHGGEQWMAPFMAHYILFRLKIHNANKNGAKSAKKAETVQGY